MKRMTRMFALSCALFCLALMPGYAAEENGVKIGIVNFKKCVEDSKLGQEEQANFEKLKKQMETILSDKEKVLNGMIEKMNDADYLDSLSPEAETDLKRKLRNLSQEMGQLQNQYLQTLSQLQFKIGQKINDVIARASKVVAKSESLHFVFNDESLFDYQDKYDISSKVVKEMNLLYEKEDMGAHLEAPEALDLVAQGN